MKNSNSNALLKHKEAELSRLLDEVSLKLVDKAKKQQQGREAR